MVLPLLRQSAGVLNKVTVKVRRFFPGHASCSKVHRGNTELEIVRRRPLEIVHQAPQVISPNIKAFVNGLFQPLQKACYVANTVIIMNYAVFSNGLCSLKIRAVLCDLNGALDIIQIMEKMNCIVNGFGIVLRAVIQEITAL